MFGNKQIILANNNVILDLDKCIACWICIDKCKQKVFGKIDLFFHKHVVVKDPSSCNGCLCCIKSCKTGALKIKIDKRI